MADAIEIFVGDVNDVEARVYARYIETSEDGGADAERIVLKGTLCGPYCEGSRTLPAQIAFRETNEPNVAQALVPDPCTWTQELPHVYQADVEARLGDRMVAEFHGAIGLRRAQKPTNED